MSPQYERIKSASLTFRGFAAPAEDVIALVGVTPSLYGNRGEPVRPHVKTLLTRSYVIFSKEFGEGFELNDMLPALFEALGGVDRLRSLHEQVGSEFLELCIDLPARQSELSQDGYLSAAVIAEVHRLGASLSFAYF